MYIISFVNGYVYHILCMYIISFVIISFVNILCQMIKLVCTSYLLYIISFVKNALYIHTVYILCTMYMFQYIQQTTVEKVHTVYISESGLGWNFVFCTYTVRTLSFWKCKCVLTCTDKCKYEQVRTRYIRVLTVYVAFDMQCMYTVHTSTSLSQYVQDSSSRCRPLAQAAFIRCTGIKDPPAAALRRRGRGWVGCVHLEQMRLNLLGQTGQGRLESGRRTRHLCVCARGGGGTGGGEPWILILMWGQWWLRVK